MIISLEREIKLSLTIIFEMLSIQQNGNYKFEYFTGRVTQFLVNNSQTNSPITGEVLTQCF